MKRRTNPIEELERQFDPWDVYLADMLDRMEEQRVREGKETREEMLARYQFWLEHRYPREGIMSRSLGERFARERDG